MVQGENYGEKSFLKVYYFSLENVNSYDFSGFTRADGGGGGKGGQKMFTFDY